MLGLIPLSVLTATVGFLLGIIVAYWSPGLLSHPFLSSLCNHSLTSLLNVPLMLPKDKHWIMDLCHQTPFTSPHLPLQLPLASLSFCAPATQGYVQPALLSPVSWFVHTVYYACVILEGSVPHSSLHLPSSSLFFTSQHGGSCVRDAFCDLPPPSSTSCTSLSFA